MHTNTMHSHRGVHDPCMRYAMHVDRHNLFFLQSCVQTLFLPLVAFVSCCPGRPLPLYLSLLLQACSSMHALLIALTPAALPIAVALSNLAKLSRCCHGAVALHCTHASSSCMYIYSRDPNILLLVCPASYHQNLFFRKRATTKTCVFLQP
jgi:hypothetical protein